MRKTSILLVLFLLQAVHAVPIGRPIAAEHQWRVGGLASFEEVELVATNKTADAGNLTSRIFLGEAAYGFTHGSEFFLRIGTSDEKFQAGTERDLGAKIDWGFGVRGVMYDTFRDWKILGDAQYFVRPTRNFGTAEITISQYQLASAVEWHLHELYPFLGVYYEKMKLSSNNEALFPVLRSKGSVGVYAGLGYEPSANWSLHVEGRFASGSAATVGAHYRF